MQKKHTHENTRTPTHTHTHLHRQKQVWVKQRLTFTSLVVMCPFLLISSTDKDETVDSDDQNL